MSAKPKVEVPYERMGIKIPIGLYREFEEVVRSRQIWPSRQDFVIEAIKEKLDRLRVEHPPAKSKR